MTSARTRSRNVAASPPHRRSHLPVDAPRPAGRPQMPLPGLVGSDPVWLRACREVEAASESGQWLALSGERGVGKLALLQALQLRHHPIRRIEVLDAARPEPDAGWSGSLKRILDTATPGLIITHVDALDGRRLGELTSALNDAGRASAETPRWVAVTPTQVSPLPELAALMSLFPTTVKVPPCVCIWGTSRRWCRSSSAGSDPAGS